MASVIDEKSRTSVPGWMPSLKITIQVNSSKFREVYDVDDVILGQGGFGVVKKCFHKKTGQLSVAKILKLKSRYNPHGADHEAILEEAQFIKNFDHKNIMKLADVFTGTNADGIKTAWIITEFLDGGSLYDYLCSKPYKELFEHEVTFYLKQVLEAVSWLHNEQNVAHLDLKPENVMLTDSRNFKKAGAPSNQKMAKLIDLGLAHDFSNGEEYIARVGTLYYMAPEVLKLEPLGPYSDMWSIGVMTYELLTYGFLPFAALPELTYAANIEEYREHEWNIISRKIIEFDNKKPEEDFWLDNRSRKAIEFMEHLLCVNVDERCTAEKALASEWIQNTQSPKDIEEEKRKRGEKLNKSMARYEELKAKHYVQERRAEARKNWALTKMKLKATTLFLKNLKKNGENRKRCAGVRNSPRQDAKRMKNGIESLYQEDETEGENNNVVRVEMGEI